MKFEDKIFNISILFLGVAIIFNISLVYLYTLRDDSSESFISYIRSNYLLMGILTLVFDILLVLSMGFYLYCYFFVKHNRFKLASYDFQN